MKKVIILSAAGVLSFVLSTAGIYLAMPSIAPAIVHETRTHLDSLGLVRRVHADSNVQGPLETPIAEISLDSVATVPPPESSNVTQATATPAEPMTEVTASLEDSLRRAASLAKHLKTENAALVAQIKELTDRLDALQSRRLESSELGKSLTKLEDKQLGNILAGLDLDVVETLYVQASPRERSRLLQHLPPDRAARFVKTLVNAPTPAGERMEAPQIDEETEIESSNS